MVNQSVEIMKMRYMAALAVCGIVMSSCSLFRREVRTDNILPRDREQIQIDKSAKTYTPAELAKGVVKGDWAIEKVNGKEAVGEVAPFLKFVPSEHRVYGNNGCNTINAEYKYNPADSTLSFGKIISTMMSCGKAGITDYEVTAALSNVSRYAWRLDDSQYFLTLFDDKGVAVMELMHQNFQFLNGTWRVAAIDEEPVDVPGMKIVIDVDEGKLHGNTGCNIINGTLETDMDAANSISFQAIGMTRRACPDSQRYETPFVVALEEAAYARPISPEKVLLMNSQGNVVLELVRTSDTTMYD